MGRAFETLTAADVIEINRRMIQNFGGFYSDFDNNLLYREGLEHLFYEIDGHLFGVELYPGVFQKAGLIAWRINTGHIFNDGNKRTSIEACRIYLELNNYIFQIDFEVIDISLRIARDEIDYGDFVIWLRNKSVSSLI